MDFRNHPFKVEVNTELCELMKSIEKEGVLVPLLVRTNPYGEGYEVISGHRRKEAAIWAGETKVPVVIRELDVIMNQYMNNHKPDNPDSTIEMWKLREQAKMQADEVILQDIIFR